MNPILLENLLDVSRALAEVRTLDPLLQYAMKVALELFEGEKGYIVLVGHDGELEFRIRLDMFGEQISAPQSEVSRTILSKVIERRKPVVIADALTDPNVSTAQSVIALRLRSVMCVPLISRGDALGAIYIENRSNRNVFDNEDIQALEYFAAQAAVAIENAILNDALEERVAQRTTELQEAMKKLEEYNSSVVEINHRLEEEIGQRQHIQEELQRQAITDSLTGVFNRRQFFLMGEQIFREARRYPYQLSALMIDADWFKQINDQHGHSVGDVTLQMLAKHLQEHLRSADVLGRYGGEEFAVLMPHTPLEEAIQVAERLRQHISQVPVETSAGSLHLTVSIGVAGFDPDQDATVDGLIDRADQAMYAAKQAGRNKVQVSLHENSGVVTTSVVQSD
jgi:diguanylate cyclase (GGDEF)-like protein